MAFIPAFIIMVLLVVGITSLIVISIRKGTSGLKLMLLGIHITLIGGILAVDPNSNLGGVEYLIALIGLIISVAGLGLKDKKTVK